MPVDAEAVGGNIAAILTAFGVGSAGALGLWMRYKRTKSEAVYIDDRDKYYQDLRQEIEYLRKTIADQTQLVMNTKTEAAALRVTVEALQERVQELKTDRDRLQTSVAKLTEANQRQQEEIEALESEVVKLHQENTQLKVVDAPQAAQAKPYRLGSKSTS